MKIKLNILSIKKVSTLFLSLAVFLLIFISISHAGDFKIVNKTNPSKYYFVVNGTTGFTSIGGVSDPGYNIQLNSTNFIGFKLGGSYGILNSNCYTRFVRGRGGFVFGGGTAADCTSGGNKAYKMLISDDGGSTDYGLSFDVEVNDVAYEDNLFMSGRSGKIGYIGIGTNNPVVKFDVDSNSNTQAIRIRGAAESTEIADIWVGANGMLRLSTVNTGASRAFIEVDGEDDEYGFLIRESNTVDYLSPVFANLYVNDTTKDYINIVVNDVTSTPGLVITEDEYVGIRTFVPSKPLTVIGEGNVSSTLYVGSYLYVGHSSSSDNDYVYFDIFGGSNYLYWINAGDRFLFTNDLYVNGQITMVTFTAPGATILCWDGSGDSAIGDCVSLRKYKENIRDYNIGLNDVVKLRPRIYDWKNGSKNKVGFVAEEVEVSVPSLAKYRDGNLSGYQEFGMSAALVNSIKELNTENEFLMKELCNIDNTYSWCEYE